MEQPSIASWVGNAGFDEVEKCRKQMLVHVVKVSSEASHSSLVAKDIVPVIGELPTGTECSDVMLWDMYP